MRTFFVWGVYLRILPKLSPAQPLSVSCLWEFSQSLIFHVVNVILGAQTHARPGHVVLMVKPMGINLYKRKMIKLRNVTCYTGSGVVTHLRRSRGHPATSLNNLDFADDLVGFIHGKCSGPSYKNSCCSGISWPRHKRTKDRVHGHQLQLSATTGGIQLINKSCVQF